MSNLLNRDDGYLSKYVPLDYREYVTFTILKDAERNWGILSPDYPFGIFSIESYEYHEGFGLDLQTAYIDISNLILALEYGKDPEELTEEEAEEAEDRHVTYLYYYDGIFTEILHEVLLNYQYFHAVYSGRVVDEEQSVDYVYYHFFNPPLQEVW